MRGIKVVTGFLIMLPLLLGAGCSVGSVTPIVRGPKDCGTDESCFEERFKNCAPAIFLGKVQTGLVYRYEIIEPKDGKCLITSKFTENTIDPKMIGLENHCIYDNSKTFKSASEGIISSGALLRKFCNGPLIDYLEGLTK
jgi:hypothetical protein